MTETVREERTAREDCILFYFVMIKALLEYYVEFEYRVIDYRRGEAGANSENTFQSWRGLSYKRES